MIKVNANTTRIDLCKDAMYDIVRQVCLKNNKVVDINYFGFDCFAKHGVTDDTPTVIIFSCCEFNCDKFSIEQQIHLIKRIIQYHKKLCKLKILFLTNGIVDSKEREEYKTFEKAIIEVWDYEDIKKLAKDYPFDFYGFSNSKDGIVEYLSDEKLKEYQRSLIAMFKEDIRNRRLSIVLGAGVSKDFGGCDLNQLTSHLIEQLPNDFVKDKKDLLNLIGNDQISTLHFVKENIGELYGSAIFDCLYGHPKTSLEDNSTTLFQISEFILRAKTLDSIITLNYDNFLEQMLSLKKFNYNYLYKKEDYCNTFLPIYHVHGFLPQDAPIIEDYIDSVILSEDDFYNLYNAGENWQVSLQLTKYKDNVCLFVGTSLNDYNLKQLLQLSKQRFKRHYAFKEIKGASPSDLLDLNRYYSLFNVKIIWINNVSEIAKIISEF